MANYYVNPTGGNDTNDGLSVAQAYATAQKAATMVAQADKVFLAIGEYKEVLTLQTDGATGANVITWIGDSTGEIFGTDPGIVVITAQNDSALTDDRAQALDLNGKDFNGFENILFRGGTSCVVHTGSAVADSITFRKGCEFVPGHALSWTFRGSAAGQLTNLIVENCYLGIVTSAIATSGLFNMAGSTNSPATASNNAIFRNNVIRLEGAIGPYVGMLIGNASANYTTFTNNIILLPGSASYTTTTKIMHTGATGNVFAYNMIHMPVEPAPDDTYMSAAATLAGNIYKQPHMKNLHPGLFPNLGGATPVDMGNTTATYAATDDANVTHVRTSGVETIPRPQHGGTDIGAFEWNPPPKKETTTVDEGSTAMRLDRACVKEFLVPVNDSGTVTVSFRMRKNSTYSGTQPKMELSGVGLTTTSASLSVGADTWETVTISAVACSVKGLAVLRFYSYSTVNGSSVYVDNGSITRA